MAESVAEERYVFEVEWFDQQAALVRKYLLTFYPKNGQIDMVSYSIKASPVLLV